MSELDCPVCRQEFRHCRHTKLEVKNYIVKKKREELIALVRKIVKEELERVNAG